MRDTVGGRARAGQAVDQGDDAAGPADRAGQVEPAGIALRLAQRPRRQQGDGNPDRHVDEQNPPPGQVAGEQAAGQQADRDAADAHR